MNESTDNPLLADAELPLFSAIRPEHAEPAVRTVIEQARETWQRVRELGSPAFGNLVVPLELADARVERVFSPVSHLNSVTSTPEMRDAYQQCLGLLTAFETEMSQDAALCERFQELADSPEYEALEPAERKCIDDALRDFRLAGVDLPAADKARFAEIMQRLSKLGSKFEENVLDATDHWTMHVTDEDRLAGLPQDTVGRARTRARKAGEHGWRLGLDLPTFLAVMHHARDRELRYQFYEAWVTRASDTGPHAGRWDNGPVMDEILALRHEAARLTGFDNFARYSLATKMAPSGEAVTDFLRDLAARARPRALEELGEIGDLAQRLDGLEELRPWDLNYYGERLREERYRLSDEALRAYFPLPRVLEGLFDVISRLFGVGFTERFDVETWHDDVRFFDVTGEDGAIVAGFYLDPYARPGKRSGAWMDVCRGRLDLDGTRQRPVAYLTLNASPPADDGAALMTHDEAVTLFHEFGHGLHHMLTRVAVPSLSGIDGVEWDAVELPSQFLENWCWEREALGQFARRYDNGEPMPEDLFKRLESSRRHLAGLTLVRQLEFALFDLKLHAEYDPQAGARVMETLRAVREEVSVLEAPEWNRFAHSFSHVFGGGYAAGYYSYLWAEVLTADAFSLFTERGVFDEATGRAFRDEILAVGGSRPAMESFRAFRGRGPEPGPLLAQYGIAA